MRVNDTLVIDERKIEERFVRASGPGGQNVQQYIYQVTTKEGANALSDIPRGGQRDGQGIEVAQSDVDVPVTGCGDCGSREVVTT
jgi:hypothetical protein